IPRPPNSFICFRTDYCVLNKQLDSDAVRDHRVVSQLAGKAWKALPPTERKYYEDMAKQKKKEHAEMYPDYAYAPVSTKSR
ncbi:high mobility group box domain-containing protein, partial [Mycena polygramma]